MLGGLVAIVRLVEGPAPDADDAVAADHPIVGAGSLTSIALAAASSPASSSGRVIRGLDAPLIDIRRHDFNTRPRPRRSMSRRMELVEARISGTDNLVDKSASQP